MARNWTTWKKWINSQKHTIYQNWIKEKQKTQQTNNEIESVMTNLPPQHTHTKSGTDNFTGEFHQTFKELIPIFLKCFQKVEEKGTLPNSFYEASVILISRHQKKRTLQATFLDECRSKNPQQTTIKTIQRHIRQTICHGQQGFIPWVQG